MTDDRITRALQRYVEQGALAGAATLAWRAGQQAEVRCVGLRDLEAGLTVARDTIFRIASMTSAAFAP
jgi:CubicO group peptidase (beta-lactamase class C family)